MTTLDASASHACDERNEKIWKFKIQLKLGSNESIKSREFVTVDIMMTSRCLRAPKNTQGMAGWRERPSAKPQPRPSIRFLLPSFLLALTSTKALLHDSYFTPNTLASWKMPKRQEPDEDSSQSEFFVSSARIYGVTSVCRAMRCILQENILWTVAIHRNTVTFLQCMLQAADSWN
jgi:hypothetical protein